METSSGVFMIQKLFQLKFKKHEVVGTFANEDTGTQPRW